MVNDMRRPLSLLLVAAFVLAPLGVRADEKAGSPANEPSEVRGEPNNKKKKAAKQPRVVAVANSYKDGGGYNWKPKNSGTPEEICFDGETILGKGNGTFCCGFTLAVAMKVAEERKLLAEKKVDEIRDLQKDWYGDGSEKEKETLCVYGVEKLGIGKAVSHDEAKPGDFAQFWRTTGSGHSVIFLEWVEEKGKRVGVKYRSSQKSTDGIGNRVEYFSDAKGHKGKLDRKRFHLCRLHEKPGKTPAKEKSSE